RGRGCQNVRAQALHLGTTSTPSAALLQNVAPAFRVSGRGRDGARLPCISGVFGPAVCSYSRRRRSLARKLQLGAREANAQLPELRPMPHVVDELQNGRGSIRVARRRLPCKRGEKLLVVERGEQDVLVVCLRAQRLAQPWHPRLDMRAGPLAREHAGLDF